VKIGPAFYQCIFKFAYHTAKLALSEPFISIGATATRVARYGLCPYNQATYSW